MSGIQAFDGKSVKATREGGRMFVEDHHAKAINAMGGNGDAGLVNASNRVVIGTKRGMRCPACHRLWNAWNAECPKCQQPTVPEPSA